MNKNKTLTEKPKLVGRFFIEKYESEEHKKRGEAYDRHEIGRNLLLNEGIDELWTILCSAGGTKFDNSNAYLGVGDSSAAAAATQTGLQGTNKTYKGMEAGFPTFGSDQKATWKASFAGGEANHAWEEFTVANGNSDAAENLNRLVESEGTKTSGQVWDLTLEITLS